MISKLMRLYKRSHGLRQICNVAVYILHTACTIHLLNLPDKNARRDITHGVKHLEEIAEGWLCARRTLAILNVLQHKWNVELPEEASAVLSRADAKYGAWGVEHPKTPSQKAESLSPQPSPGRQVLQPPPNFFNPLVNAASSSAGVQPRRPSSNATLPPQSAADFQRNRMYQQSSPQTTTQGTPVSRASVDSNVTPAGGSPSALFGGVDQLLRDSQDWWLRDQSQLAMGFEQWPLGEGDWMASGSSPPATTNGLGFVTTNGTGTFNGANSVNGLGSGLNQYPDENEWYS
jgi:hypothetical protein